MTSSAIFSPLSPVGCDRSGAAASAPEMGEMDGMGIYVHFPWCLAKCPYCDFLSIKVPTSDGSVASREHAISTLPHSAYADAVLIEMECRARAAWPKSPPLVRSIFFGGGTPSLWKPSELARVLRGIRDRFPCSSDLEVTVECNPTSVDEAHFEALLAEGVGRVSIGVQRLSNEGLSFLGRLHDESGGLRALQCALDVGIPQVSADLIYGVYRQLPADAVDEVSRVAALGVHHLSAYTLTIEPGTRFGAAHAAGRLPLLDDALVAESMVCVAERLDALGFEHYEISNYARPGHQSRHNRGYWVGRDYLGLGTGAFGTVTLGDPRPGAQRLRYRNVVSPERSMEHFGRTACPEKPFDAPLAERELIPPETSIQEALMLGLRLRDGVNLKEVGRHFGAEALTPERSAAIDRLGRMGRVDWVEDRLRIPPSCWHLADGIIVELL